MENRVMGVVGGLGHIGLIQAAGLAEAGYRTIAYDKDAGKVRRMREGVVPFYEPELEDLVRKMMECGRLVFTDRVHHLREADMVYICVDTPPLPNGAADTSRVRCAVEEVAENRFKDLTVVVKSTVPVGTARSLDCILRERGLAARVTVVSNPEFLREGTGLYDFRHPTRVVVGAQSQEIAQRVAEVYCPPGVPVILTGWENAELIKYAANAFLATKISFINELSRLCEQMGGDIRVISEGIGLDPRIGPHFLEAGVGFSGPCLEKDLKSLIRQFIDTGEEPALLQAVLRTNDRQRISMICKLQDRLGSLRGKRIGVLGMVFKPETDDVRDSHSLPIVRHLLSRGAVVTVHDLRVRGPAHAGIPAILLPGVEWASSAYEAIAGRDAVLILTAWPEYRELDLRRLADMMRRPIVVDGRNLFDPRVLSELGIDYQGVGI